MCRPARSRVYGHLSRPIGTSLPTLSFATLASPELNVQHTLPESEGALRVVGWKLDEGDGRAIHPSTIAALDDWAASAVLAMKRAYRES
jgi:hypothetical protein